jgi:hypothetical protein
MVVDRGVIVTKEMRQAAQYANLVREGGLDIDVTGAMKHTFVKYITQGATNSAWLSSIKLMAMKKLRSVLTGLDKSHQIFIVDDSNLQKTSYLKYLRLNGGRFMHPDHEGVISAPSFTVITI